MQIVCQKLAATDQIRVKHLMKRCYKDMSRFNKTTNAGLWCHFGRTKPGQPHDMAPIGGRSKSYPKLDLMIFALKESRF